MIVDFYSFVAVNISMACIIIFLCISVIVGIRKAEKYGDAVLGWAMIAISSAILILLVILIWIERVVYLTTGGTIG